MRTGGRTLRAVLFVAALPVACSPEPAPTAPRPAAASREASPDELEVLCARPPPVAQEVDASTGADTDASAPDAAAALARIRPGDIQTVVRKHFPCFGACYQRGLLRNAELSGKVNTSFVIERGRVWHVEPAEGTTLPDAEVVSCVGEAFRRLVFPNGERATVVYPLIFSPSGR